MRAHTITTKARVGGGGRAKDRIVPRGILALSLAVVLLAATASTASAERTLSTWYCPPLTPPPTNVLEIPPGCLGGPLFGNPSFDFGDRQVGTTSPVQRFALGVWCRPNDVCPETLNPSIGVSGDYAQTNNCPATLSANDLGQLQGCVINVTFTPTGIGPKAGSLSAGPGGPTATLTGNGVTHATPPALPLLLLDFGYHTGFDVHWALLRKKLTLFATSNHESTVVASGGVKRTVAQLADGEPPKTTTFKAKVKHLRRLKESAEPKARIRLTATDEFGQRATGELKVEFCRKVRQGYCVR